LNKASSGVFIIVCIMAFCLVNSSIVKAQTANSWESKAAMPTARSGFGIAVVNGDLYAIGGYNKDQTDFSAVNEKYNPALNSWVQMAPMPTHRVSFGIAVFENKIYVFGGQILVNGHRQVIKTTEVYDPASDTWATKTPMPHLGEDFAANVVVGDKIYVISTYNDVYDPMLDSWSTKATIPEPVAHSANAVVNDKIYVISGTHYGNEPQFYVPINLTQIYDPASDSWSSGAPIPNPIASSAAVATVGSNAPKAIYVFGGLTLTPDSNGGFIYHAQKLTQIYYPESDSWSFGAPMPTARYALAVGAVDDKVYAMGGSDAKTAPDLPSNELYLPLGYAELTNQVLPRSAIVGIAVVLVVILITATVLVWRTRETTKK
jgi:N-acetylneuraminic acid mutarotase